MVIFRVCVPWHGTAGHYDGPRENAGVCLGGGTGRGGRLSCQTGHADRWGETYYFWIRHNLASGQQPAVKYRYVK